MSISARVRARSPGLTTLQSHPKSPPGPIPLLSPTEPLPCLHLRTFHLLAPSKRFAKSAPLFPAAPNLTHPLTQ